MTEAMSDSQLDRVITTTDPESGDVEASAVFDTTPERLFRALTTKEICNWWVRPGVFNTQEWTGDVREGGRWAAAGVGGGQPYQLEGVFLTIDAPRKLSHTWKPVGAAVEPATLTCDLEPQADGLRLTLRHASLPNPEVCEKTRAGWETSLVRLQELISAEKG